MLAPEQDADIQSPRRGSVEHVEEAPALVSQMFDAAIDVGVQILAQRLDDSTMPLLHHVLRTRAEHLAPRCQGDILVPQKPDLVRT
jgi:hypothetical protein